MKEEIKKIVTDIVKKGIPNPAEFTSMILAPSNKTTVLKQIEDIYKHNIITAEELITLVEYINEYKESITSPGTGGSFPSIPTYPVNIPVENPQWQDPTPWLPKVYCDTNTTLTK